MSWEGWIGGLVGGNGILIAFKTGAVVIGNVSMYIEASGHEATAVRQQ